MKHTSRLIVAAMLILGVTDVHAQPKEGHQKGDTVVFQPNVSYYELVRGRLVEIRFDEVTYGEVIGGRSTYVYVKLGDSTVTVNAHAGGNPRLEREKKKLREAEERKKKKLKEAEDRQKKKMQQKGIPIFLSVQFKFSRGRSTTGWVKVQNLSDETIKYIKLTVTGLNSVGDPVANSVGGYTKQLRMVGPVKPNVNLISTFDPIGYSDLAVCFEVNRVSVEFAGGGTWIGVRDLADLKAAALAMGDWGFKLEGDCPRY